MAKSTHRNTGQHPGKSEVLEKKLHQQEILLSLSAEIIRIKNKPGLMTMIRETLGQLFSFSHATVTLICEDRKHWKTFLLDSQSGTRHHKQYNDLISLVYPIEDGIYNRILETEGSVIFNLDELVAAGNVPPHIIIQYESGIKEIAAITLTCDNIQLGVLSFYAKEHGAFTRDARDIIEQIAGQVSLAVANIQASDEIERRDRENEILLELNMALVAINDKDDLLKFVRDTLSKYINYTDCNIVLYNRERRTFANYLYWAQAQRLQHPAFPFMIATEYTDRDDIETYHMPVIMNIDDQIKLGREEMVVLRQMGLQEFISVKLQDGDNILGLLVLLSEQVNTFSENDLVLLKKISFQLSSVLANILANQKIGQQLEEINRYKQQLEEENHYFKEATATGYTYSDIIGTGEAMQKMFHLLGQVAYANSTVLILGETGTGKELVARAIHNSSPRKDKLMVKVNCAAMPASLIESELFGHEKGSFTGATERRIGKFELANKGTLFLDEIGEMPVDLQVKLLRALQEKEIERVGGRGPIKIDVRIIAATNRNLKKEVAEGRFREDLFYRLNVFPITLPPLRERKEDIPALASHFIGKYSRNAGRKEMSLSSKALKELMSYDWPGNVRELEHLLERSVLLTTGNVIKEIDLPVIYKNNARENKDYSRTLAEMEREYIVEVLKRCNGKVYGPGGAAEVLGLRVSTLNSRIKKLGIKKETLIS